MAKKKQPELQQEQEKVFEVIPAVYEQFNWGIGWEKEEAGNLAESLVSEIADILEKANVLEYKDIVLHETLNSFKGNSDNLKAFLFLDTAVEGNLYVVDDEPNDIAVKATKGTLIILKGYNYSFSTTLSAKRRVLELIF